VGHDLMSMKVEVHPSVGAASFRATEQLAVEAACGSEVIDRKGEMEGRESRHCECSEAIQFIVAGLLRSGASRNDEIK